MCWGCKLHHAAGAHESRKRCAVTGRQPSFLHALSGATEARERYALSGRQPIFLHALSGADELRKRYVLSGLGISPSADGGNGAPTRRGRTKGVDTYGFYPSCESPRFPLFLSRRTERLRRSYLSSGPKKGTAVPLPVHRPQSAIPFTAALKPLELCDSIYAKPVQSAAITPRQCGKRKPIPVPICELPMK